MLLSISYIYILPMHKIPSRQGKEEMTVNYERFNSAKSTREFLAWILESKCRDLKPRELKDRAYRLLKHFPEDWWLDDVKKKLPEM
jgi:hypothetical protein